MPYFRKRLLLLVAIVLLVALAAFILIGLPGNSTPSDTALTNQDLAEKGAQIALATEPAGTPFPTGPQPPTPASRPFVAPVEVVRPNPTPTFPALKVSPTAGSAQLPAMTPTESAPTPTPTPVTLIPYRIRIPDINIDTYVEQVGIARDGTMDVPKNIWNTGWFADGGYIPGEIGNAVITGHLDAPGTKAVFWDLDHLKPGNRIYLRDQGGREMVFEVQSLEVYPFDKAPLQTIFGPASQPQLNLVTCRGTFDRSTHNYNKRLVVYSHLVS